MPCFEILLLYGEQPQAPLTRYCVHLKPFHPEQPLTSKEIPGWYPRACADKNQVPTRTRRRGSCRGGPSGNGGHSHQGASRQRLAHVRKHLGREPRAPRQQSTSTNTRAPARGMRCSVLRSDNMSRVASGCGFAACPSAATMPAAALRSHRPCSAAPPRSACVLHRMQQCAWPCVVCTAYPHPAVAHRREPRARGDGDRSRQNASVRHSHALALTRGALVRTHRHWCIHEARVRSESRRGGRPAPKLYQKARSAWAQHQQTR